MNSAVIKKLLVKQIWEKVSFIWEIVVSIPISVVHATVAKKLRNERNDCKHSYLCVHGIYQYGRGEK